MTAFTSILMCKPPLEALTRLHFCPMLAWRRVGGVVMAWYVVSYDLRREVTQADWYRLYTTLQGAVDFCWPLQSFWIIETPRTPRGVIEVLVANGAIDGDDGVVVLEITGVGDFRMVKSKETADWLNQKITRR
jgi:hypothetical protein